MEGLPESLLEDIVKRVTGTNDRNSLSLVLKQICSIEVEQRDAIRVGCGLHRATEAIASLCPRFLNLRKVEIDYFGWTSSRGKQLDNEGLHVLSSQCSLLKDLTLSFCSCIDHSGLRYLSYCKKLRSLRLNSLPAISSSQHVHVAVSTLSHIFYIVNYIKVSSLEWLEDLGRAGSLEELVLNDCKGVSPYDLINFGPGWMNLRKFELMTNGTYWLWPSLCCSDLSAYPYRHAICCENLKELRLGHIAETKETGVCFLLHKCIALEKLWLENIVGLTDSDMIALFQNCRNLRIISLGFVPKFLGGRVLTDESLRGLALFCPMLQVLELTFSLYTSNFLPGVGFSQEGIVMLVKSCPIRALVLNGVHIFDDEGMEAISSSQFLETLELVNCSYVKDSGICSIARAPITYTTKLWRCD